MTQRVRTYLPATLATVAELHTRGEVAASSAYAVTPALRVERGNDDQEELEYEAFSQAASASLELLSADPVPPRRVVISADIPVEPVQAARVRPLTAVPLAAVAAVHVDGVAAESAVAAVLTSGDGDLDDELEWYDVSELDQLLP